MWWFDRQSVSVGIKIRDLYNVKTFVETGTFRGVNLKFWAYYFNKVVGCELNPEYYEITSNRIKTAGVNIDCELYQQSSPDFLQNYIEKYRNDKRADYVIFYLDAHFFNPDLPEKFVVKDELKALKDFDKAIIIIHDFDVSGLGHIFYENHSLNFAMVKDLLHDINPNFDYYRNTKERSDPMTVDTIKYVFGLDADEDTIETINYHQEDRLKYRGMLYCLPRLYNLEQL